VRTQGRGQQDVEGRFLFVLSICAIIKRHHTNFLIKNKRTEGFTLTRSIGELRPLKYRLQG
jgi:hypothetical protein